jgi:hypothetical protein
MMIRMMQKLAEFFSSFVLLQSRIRSSSRGKNISNLFLSVLPLVHNHLGNPITPTYIHADTTQVNRTNEIYFFFFLLRN